MVDTIGNDLKQMQGSILEIGGLENGLFRFKLV